MNEAWLALKFETVREKIMLQASDKCSRKTITLITDKDRLLKKRKIITSF